MLTLIAVSMLNTRLGRKKLELLILRDEIMSLIAPPKSEQKRVMQWIIEIAEAEHAIARVDIQNFQDLIRVKAPGFITTIFLMYSSCCRATFPNQNLYLVEYKKQPSYFQTLGKYFSPSRYYRISRCKCFQFSLQTSRW